MANYFNILAGFITFLGASALAYALWSPVMSFLDYFIATAMPLYVMCGTIWVAINFVSIVLLPFIMLVGDDSGR